MSDVQQLAERLALPIEVTEHLSNRRAHFHVHDSLIGQLRSMLTESSKANPGNGELESKSPVALEVIDLLVHLDQGTRLLLAANNVKATAYLESDVLALAAHVHEFTSDHQGKATLLLKRSTLKAERMLGWKPQPRRLRDVACFDCGVAGTVIVEYTEVELIGGTCESVPCRAARLLPASREQGTYTAERAAMLGLRGRYEQETA